MTSSLRGARTSREINCVESRGICAGPRCVDGARSRSLSRPVLGSFSPCPCPLPPILSTHDSACPMIDLAGDPGSEDDCIESPNSTETDSRSRSQLSQSASDPCRQPIHYQRPILMSKISGHGDPGAMKVTIPKSDSAILCRTSWSHPNLRPILGVPSNLLG